MTLVFTVIAYTDMGHVRWIGIGWSWPKAAPVQFRRSNSFGALDMEPAWYRLREISRCAPLPLTIHPFDNESCSSEQVWSRTEPYVGTRQPRSSTAAVQRETMS